VGGGMKLPVCGDGIIDAGEECDDDKPGNGDGCSDNCKIEKDWFCRDEPSDCVPFTEFNKDIMPDANLSMGMTATAYTGGLMFPSMYCADVDVMGIGTDLGKVAVTVKLDSSRIGDIVIKVQSPMMTISTLLSRPGHMEADDEADMVPGANCNLKFGHPILFDDDMTHSAEDMGLDTNMNVVATGKEVCKDSKVCRFKPNKGSSATAEGMNGLADFQTEDPNGTWKVCVADANQMGAVLKYSEAVLRIAAF
jgi:cysteine-rich repeat protein